MTGLPQFAPSPCAGCRGHCCTERSVSLTAFDLCRLMDAFRVGWEELAVAGAAFAGGGFRLDATTSRWNFRLKQRASGRCIFGVGDEYVRCAAHVVRPASCRIYPFYVGLRDDGVRVAVGNNAACPPSLAMAWSELALPDAVQAELAEHTRYQEVIARWESRLSTEKREIHEFLTFAREAL